MMPGNVEIGSIIEGVECRGQSYYGFDLFDSDNKVYTDFTVYGEEKGTLTEPAYWKIRCNECGHETLWRK